MKMLEVLNDNIAFIWVLRVLLFSSTCFFIRM